MKVTVVFDNDHRVEWGFADGAVPREGDILDITDAEAPKSPVRVLDVVWLVTERGCGEAVLYVS